MAGPGLKNPYLHDAVKRVCDVGDAQLQALHAEHARFCEDSYPRIVAEARVLGSVHPAYDARRALHAWHVQQAGDLAQLKRVVTDIRTLPLYTAPPHLKDFTEYCRACTGRRASTSPSPVARGKAAADTAAGSWAPQEVLDGLENSLEEHGVSCPPPRPAPAWPRMPDSSQCPQLLECSEHVPSSGWSARKMSVLTSPHAPHAECSRCAF